MSGTGLELIKQLRLNIFQFSCHHLLNVGIKDMLLCPFYVVLVMDQDFVQVRQPFLPRATLPALS